MASARRPRVLCGAGIERRRDSAALRLTLHAPGLSATGLPALLIERTRIAATT